MQWCLATTAHFTKNKKSIADQDLLFAFDTGPTGAVFFAELVSSANASGILPRRSNFLIDSPSQRCDVVADGVGLHLSPKCLPFVQHARDLPEHFVAGSVGAMCMVSEVGLAETLVESQKVRMVHITSWTIA